MQKPILAFFSGTLVLAKPIEYLTKEHQSQITFDEYNSLNKEKGSTSHDVDSKISLEELSIQSDKKESGKEGEIEDAHEESHQEHQEEPLQLDISSGQPLPKE